jgi:hypothetical protein
LFPCSRLVVTVIYILVFQIKNKICLKRFIISWIICAEIKFHLFYVTCYLIILVTKYNIEEIPNAIEKNRANFYKYFFLKRENNKSHSIKIKEWDLITLTGFFLYNCSVCIFIVLFDTSNIFYVLRTSQIIKQKTGEAQWFFS